MAIITVGSLGHSPGTTTTAVALAMRWPRSAVLVEADVSKTSSILAGRLRGQVPHRMGLTNLAGAAIHGELDPSLLWANSIPLAEDRRLVPGFSSLGAARGAGEFWPDLLAVLSSLDQAGSDVIVDLGRCEVDDARASIITTAASMLVTCGTSLPDIAAVTAPIDGRVTRLGGLAALLDGVGHLDAMRLVLIERSHENYSASEIRRVTGAPVGGSLPYAPHAAATYSHGASSGSHKRGLRDAYERALSSLIEHTRDAIVHHDRRLGERRSASGEER